MKKYIDAQLQVVRIIKTDIVTASDVQAAISGSTDSYLGADRFRDEE